MEQKISLGKIISSRRKYMHLTQEELADRIGVSKSAVAKWETDGGIPDRDNLKRVSEILNLSVDDIYRIIRNTDKGTSPPRSETLNINITSDVISVLESYGYTIIQPVERNF